MLNLYTANLAECTAGNLEGEWISLPTEIETIDAHLNAVLGVNKGIVIRDYESSLPIEVRETDDIYELNRIMQYLAAVAKTEREIIALIAKTKGLELAQVIQIHQDGEYMAFNCHNLKELGQYLYDEGFLSYKIPKEVVDFVDMEKLASDWLSKGEFVDLSNIGYYITY
ncbi:antirestriction protein ArdA [Sporosarcina gallistercoris]|uniref:Antirestriction protein ArdA n=1 Tax=Sporosarcina gallistercoris TaxID=2762245 RepID=A0ABR8PIK4_9BACL|nr:antirestriction protein ArdA [Sporosarcina gallistercoris]MBD7908018.1 antirestriction protein ArdA [Sporosarcina gallistercoris]